MYTVQTETSSNIIIKFLMNILPKMTIRLFLIITSLLMLQGCSNDIENTNQIIVATSADNPPYEFVKKGEVVGADIDMINEVVKLLGKKITIQNLDFTGLMQSLAANNVDMVVAALSVTEARSKHVDFSIPYFKTQMALLYRANDPVMDDVALKNKTVGVQLGSTWENAAQILGGRISSLKIRSLNNNLVLVEELKSSIVDCVILEEAQAKKFQENNENFTYRLLNEFSSEFAIALPKGSPLLADVNIAINTLKENGTLQQINNKWLQQ